MGDSDQMKKIRIDINKIPTNAKSILLLGANGTEKESVARTLHLISNTKNKPFLSLKTTYLTQKQIGETDPCGGRHERFLTGDPHFWATGCRTRALFDLVNAQVLEVPVEFLGTSAQGFEVSG